MKKLLLLLPLVCLGQGLPPVPTISSNLAFDELEPPPWYPGTNWTNLPESIQLKWEAHELPVTNVVQIHNILRWHFNTNYPPNKFPGVLIQYGPADGSSVWVFDLVDRLETTQYDVTLCLAICKSNWPNGGYVQAIPWWYTTPGVHNR